MTTLREAALAALALVNDTLLERTVDTKRLSAVGRDLEDALDAEHAQPVAWIKDTSLIALKRDESTVMAYPHDYLIRPAVPLYAADAIREAVLAEREACASLIEPKNPRSDWTEYAEAKADCAAMIRSRGAA